PYSSLCSPHFEPPKMVTIRSIAGEWQMVNRKWRPGAVRDERLPLDSRDVQRLFTIYYLPFTSSQGLSL
ncbi:MAG TPA: hypothetical protein VE642_00550, partial [Pyrinomonadaceae bacterium]|nr:hypothetical protein [Pyrinomonadaceae bacterium]